MPTSSGGLRGGNYATVYRSSLPSPATHTTARSRSASRSHHPRAPGLTGQATQAPTLQLKIPSSRPLPAGPGPLDRQGRKLEGFALGGDYSRPRVPTTTGLGPSSLRPGPLKADHSSVVSTNLRYSSTSERASGLSKKGARGGEGEGDHRRSSATIGSGLSTRRSSSLANLHISDETSSSTSTAGRGAAHCDSDDRLRRSSSRRRNSQVYDGVTGGASNHGRQSSGSEKGGRKGGGGGGARYASRTASPSTSAGTSLREGGAVREDPSTSRIPSHSSSSSSSMST